MPYQAGDYVIYHVKDVEELTAPAQIDEVLDDNEYAVRLIGDEEVFTAPESQLTLMKTKMS